MKDTTLGIASNNAPPGLCSKREYPNKKSAKASAKNQRRKYKLSPYICPRCGHFHLGSADSEEKEIIRKGRCLDRIETNNGSE